MRAHYEGLVAKLQTETLETLSKKEWGQMQENHLKEIKLLESRLTSIQRDAHVSHEENRRVNEALTESEKLIKSNDEQILNLQNQSSQLAREQASLAEKNTLYESQIANLQESIKEREAALEAVQSKVYHKNDGIKSQHEAEKRTLQEKVETLQSQITQMMNQLCQKSDKIAELQDQLDSSFQEFKAVPKETQSVKIQAMETQMKRLSDIVDKTTSQNAELQKALDESLQKNLDENILSKKQSQALEARAKKLDQMLQVRESELAEAQRNLEQLKTSSSSFIEINRQASSLESENRRIQALLTDQTGEVDRLKFELDHQRQESLEIVQIYQKQLRTIEIELDEKSDAVESIKRQLLVSGQSSEKILSEFQTHQAQLHEKNALLEMLKSDHKIALDEQAKTIQGLTLMLKQKAESIDELERELFANRKTLEEFNVIKIKNEELENGMWVLQKKVDAMTLAVEDKDVLVARAKEEINQMSSRAQDFEEQLLAERAKVDTMKEQV